RAAEVVDILDHLAVLDQGKLAGELRGIVLTELHLLLGRDLRSAPSRRRSTRERQDGDRPPRPFHERNHRPAPCFWGPNPERRTGQRRGKTRTRDRGCP